MRFHEFVEGVAELRVADSKQLSRPDLLAVLYIEERRFEVTFLRERMTGVFSIGLRSLCGRFCNYGVLNIRDNSIQLYGINGVTLDDKIYHYADAIFYYTDNTADALKPWVQFVKTSYSWRNDYPIVREPSACMVYSPLMNRVRVR